jgi:hypothetical protein
MISSPFQANKGAVSIRMDLFGADIIFVNSHFEAHVDNTEDRLEVSGFIKRLLLSFLTLLY